MDSAIQLLLLFISKADQWGKVIQAARDEGREITQDEIDTFRADYQESETEVMAEIAKAREEGR